MFWFVFGITYSSCRFLCYEQLKTIPWYVFRRKISYRFRTGYILLFLFFQLVELKNGETYNGHLVSCDNWMNINLREVICTSKVCYIYLNCRLKVCNPWFLDRKGRWQILEDAWMLHPWQHNQIFENTWWSYWQGQGRSCCERTRTRWW